MEKEILTPEEKCVIQWANEKGYVVRPRQWGKQTDEETKAIQNLGIIGADIGLGYLNITGKEADLLAYMDQNDTSYKRDVFVPKGLISYKFINLDESGEITALENNEQLLEILKSQKLYSNELEWYVSGYFPNWKSEKCTIGERKIKGLYHEGFDGITIVSDGSFVQGTYEDKEIQDYSGKKTSLEHVAGILKLIQGDLE